MSARESTGFRVRPDELEAAGRTAVELAARAPAEIHGVARASDRTTGVLGRCDVAAALHDCTEAWHLLLTDLSTSMNRRGQGLIETARAYRGTDADVAAGLSAAGFPAAGATAGFGAAAGR